MTTNSSRADTIIALFAAVIALVAIGVSTWQGLEQRWQGAEQRRHNRLSVRPALSSDIDYAADGTVLDIKLKNAGTGPALVKQFTIFVDDKPVQAPDNDIWSATVRELNISDRKFIYEFYTYEVGDVIAANDLVPIFNMNPDDYRKLKNKEIWKQAMLRVKVSVVYKSIYDEEFQAHCKPMKSP